MARPSFILEEPKTGPVFTLDETGPIDPNPAPDFDVESFVDFNDRPDPIYEPRDMNKVAERSTKVWDIAQKTGIDVTLVDMFYPLLKDAKPNPETSYKERYSWRNDVGRAIDETPRNLYIGVLTGSAGIANAFKKEGMRWAGAMGIVPDDMTRHLFEVVPVEPRLRKKPFNILGAPSTLPGAIVGEAFGVALRAPDAIAKMLNYETQTQQAKLDEITLSTSPISRALRPVFQNVPTYGVAIGLGILTGDSALTLGILGTSASGAAFQKQLDEGGSVLKAQFIGDLSMAAEIGGEMLVVPKIIKGFAEGIPLRQVLMLVGLNAGQEGVTSYTQTFLEVIGTETTKGTSYKEATRKAHDAAIKAVPEAMWVGGILAGGPAVAAGRGTAKQVAQTEQSARNATIVNTANKDIAEIQRNNKGQRAERLTLDRIGEAQIELSKAELEFTAAEERATAELEAEVAEAPAEPITPEKPTEAPAAEAKAPPIKQAGGIVSEKISVSLRIGNITPGFKKRLAKATGLKAEDIHGFKEGAFPTKRTDIELTRGQATSLLTEHIIELDRKLEANEINTEADLVQANILVGDIKALQDALGLTVKPAQFVAKRAKKQRTAAIAQEPILTDAEYNELVDRINAGEKLTEEERASMVVALEQERTALKSVVPALTTKQAIEAAVRPQELERVEMSTLQLFNKVMEGRSKEAQHAYIAGARETVKQHKNLAELARIKLEGLEVTEAQRTRLMKTVARARTDSEQVVAMASVQAVADKANFKAAKTELQSAIKSIPKFGKVYNVRQAAIDKINAALEGTDLTTLSEAKKAELEGIQQDLIDVGFKIEQGIENAPDEEVEGIKSVIGDNALAQLRRLGKTPLADMKPEEIQGMADAIRYAVTQNALQNKMIKGAETQDATKVVKKANTQIAPTRRAGKVEAREVSERETRAGAIRVGGRVIFKDSMHIYVLTSTSTKKGASEMERVLDIDRYAGERKRAGAELDSSDFIHDELQRMGWSDTDIKRVDEEHTVTLDGKKYKLTTQEIMSLGMNLKSERNLNELGRTEGLWIGKRDVNKPTVGEVVDALEVLTETERAAMDMVRPLNEQHLMGQINEVSGTLMGSDLARNPDHWSIRRKMGMRVRSQTAAIEAGAIEDQGPFQPFLGSKRRMQIIPFWDQLSSTVQNAAAYNGQAIPMRNARTLLNNESWQQSMRDAGREAEMQNLFTIFRRIQGSTSDKTAIDIAGQSVLSNAAQSLLKYRVSTMFIQKASEHIAHGVSGIPHKYRLPVTGVKTQKGKAQSERMDKFSAPLRLRHLGGKINLAVGDIAAADTVNRMFFRQSERFKGLEGMRVKDRQVMVGLDTKVQRWVADTTKLEFGSDKFWTEVAHRTEDVMRKTQPMWDVSERSVLSSSPNFALKGGLMFRSAREQMLNQKMLAYDNVLKGVPGAKVELANTLAVNLTSYLHVHAIRRALFAATTVVASTLVHREPPDWEDVKELVDVDRFVEDLGFDAVLSDLPFGTLVRGAIKKAIGRPAWDDMDLNAILVASPVEAAEATNEFRKAFEAYMIDDDDERARVHLLEGTTKLIDAIQRLRGGIGSGAMQVTTDPIIRELKKNIADRGPQAKTFERMLLDTEERNEGLIE